MTEPFLLKDYLSCMLKIRRMDPLDFQVCIAKFMDGDEKAGHLLEERCLPQVVRWVLPYRGFGISFQALIELGNRGLLKAIRCYRKSGEVDVMDCMERAVVAEVEAVVLANRPAALLR